MSKTSQQPEEKHLTDEPFGQAGVKYGSDGSVVVVTGAKDAGGATKKKNAEEGKSSHLPPET